MNRLGEAESSYLRRAADEPIDWYPWGDEAFERAKEEEKPVLLSIGAVWCHWCHVMARETWHDRGTAALVNERFIAIKVDRDDRPDLDRAYQEAVQALTGNGGWPLTVFLTPDQQPFYGGTYFPPRPQHGLPAFRDVLQAVSDLFSADRGSVERIVNDLTQRFQYVSPLRQPVEPQYLDAVVGQMHSSFDSDHGGFGAAPKFPYSEALLFLLQYYEASGDQRAWQIADTTLRHMAAGGVYDQLGGGFHRYSTDAKWQVPHFEKMLSDNALLLGAYLGAYQLSGTGYFRQVASEIVDFTLRDLAREPAGFISSIDADLHHEEGAYYAWEEQEIREVLGDRTDAFTRAYNVTRGGNFEPGKNVLYPGRESDKGQFAAEKQALLEVRDRREKPYADRSIHTSWTALMVTALARAYPVLGERRCLDYAAKTADFLLDKAYKDGTLYRTYTDRPVFSGYLEDYACTIEALLELFEVAQDSRYLDRAEALAADCDRKFFDRDQGGYFFVQAEDRTELTRDKPVTDFSVPGSNPQMAVNLLKLSYYRDNRDNSDRAQALVEGFYDLCRQYPLGHGMYFGALEYYFHPPETVAVVGPEKEGRALVDLVNSRLLKKIVLLDHGQYRQRPAIFEGKAPLEGKATAYFCKDRTCTVPLTDREDILELLKRPKFGPEK